MFYLDIKNLFLPKIITCLRDYEKKQLTDDIIAGIIVAIIALPLSIALAIASGVGPEKGIITAIIGGFLVSTLGGSRVQIGGPTGAFVVIVLGIIAKHGVIGLIAATFMAGILLVLMGAFKLGDLIKYIPYPITTGFTSGIAIIIFSTQVKDFLGLSAKNIPGEFIEKWLYYFEHMGTANISAILIGLLTIFIIIFWPRVNKKIPGAFMAIIVATAIVTILKLDVQTIYTQFGEISGSIPAPRIPNISFGIFKDLFMSAVAIAILGAIESLLSAVVADGMIGGSHRSNTELIGQGFANIGSALFGGIPVTGAIARTAANVKNGGRTPIAGMVHSVTLLCMMLVLMPYVKYIPMAALAGILIVVAYNMGEWEEFIRMRKAPKSDEVVFLVTFLLTIVFDLVVAIEVGMVLAAFLFMKRMADVTECKAIDIHSDDHKDELRISYDKIKHQGVQVYEIDGPFFFGAADKFIKTLNTLEKDSKCLIIKLGNVSVIDATGYEAFIRIYKICKKHKIVLKLVNVKESPLKTLEKFGFIELIGSSNIHGTMTEALGTMD
jgi:SulP family sulfate permease